MSQLLSDIWGMVSGTSDEFVALGFTLLGAFVLYLFRLKPKLIYGAPHRSRHLLNLNDPDAEDETVGQEDGDNLLEVYNEQFFVLNEGRRGARNVDIVLSNFPRNIAIYPPCDWGVKNVEKGLCQVRIPYIAPRELVTVDCIYLNQLAAQVVSVRCEEGAGKAVPFWTLKRYPNWANWLVFALLIFGIAFVVQFGLDAVRAYFAYVSILETVQ